MKYEKRQNFSSTTKTNVSRQREQEKGAALYERQTRRTLAVRVETSTATNIEVNKEIKKQNYGERQNYRKHHGREKKGIHIQYLSPVFYGKELYQGSRNPTYDWELFTFDGVAEPLDIKSITR